MFQNRIDAGKKLAIALKDYAYKEDALVTALPRGGVVLGYEVAKELNLPLEITLIKKIGHPANPEYAIGAVSLSDIILNGHEDVAEEYIETATKNIRKLLNERYQLYYGKKPPINLKNKTVIVVDDGIATGKTLMASLKLIKRQNPAEIIVAVPVAPTSIINTLKPLVDKVVCLEIHDTFYSVGFYYDDFRQVTDKEVIQLMQKANKEMHDSR